MGMAILPCRLLLGLGAVTTVAAIMAVIMGATMAGVTMEVEVTTAGIIRTAFRRRLAEFHMSLRPGISNLCRTQGS